MPADLDLACACHSAVGLTQQFGMVPGPVRSPVVDGGAKTYSCEIRRNVPPEAERSKPWCSWVVLNELSVKLA